jgi:DNA-directed RNA polymerase specialized sigma24 family protein
MTAMPRTLLLTDTRTPTPSEVALASKLVTPMDLLRLKAIARLYARGLSPDASWLDLLQEALARVISGARGKPQGIAMVAFIAGIMRSLRSEHWRRARARKRWQGELPQPKTGTKRALEARESAPDPERALIAQQELDAISGLFVADPRAREIIRAMAEGLNAEETIAALGICRTEYDSARRRIRRCLLREGLTCERK